jgi:hypothetical protein
MWSKCAGDICEWDQLGARALANGTVEVYRNGTLITTRSITSWPYYANGGYINDTFHPFDGSGLNQYRTLGGVMYVT